MLDAGLDIDDLLIVDVLLSRDMSTLLQLILATNLRLNVFTNRMEWQNYALKIGIARMNCRTIPLKMVISCRLLAQYCMSLKKQAEPERLQIFWGMFLPQTAVSDLASFPDISDDTVNAGWDISTSQFPNRQHCDEEQHSVLRPLFSSKGLINQTLNGRR